MSTSIPNLASSYVPLVLLVLFAHLLALHFIALCMAAKMDLNVGFTYSPQINRTSSSSLGVEVENGVFLPILSTSNFTNGTDSFSFGMLAAFQPANYSDCNLYLCVCTGQMSVINRTASIERRLGGRSDDFTIDIYTLQDSTAVPIWNANPRRPLTSFNAMMMVRQDKAFELLDVDGSLVWNVSNVAAMEILESGNLVIYDSTNGTIWQSFDHPSDTLIDGQRLSTKLTSNDSVYSMALERQGLVFYYFDLQTVDWPMPYWRIQFANISSSCNDATSVELIDGHFWLRPGCSSGTDDDIDFFQSGFMSFLRLENDGRFRGYHQSGLGLMIVGTLDQFESTGNTDPDHNIIDIMTPCFVPMSCGPYSICSGNEGHCGCPLGDFTPNVLGDSSQGCHRSLPLPQCSVQDGLTFLEINHTSTVLFISGATFNTTPTAEDCKHSCMSNCSCVAVFYDRTTTSCFPVHGGISLLNLTGNMANLTSANYVTYLKQYSSSPLSPTASNSSPTVFPTASNSSSARPASRIVIGVLVVVSVLLFLAGLAMSGRSLLKKRGAEDPNEAELLRLLPSLPTKFSYRELHTATQGFNTLLGAGGFASVYAGALSDGREIAVKTLDFIVRGDMSKQFLAEVATIGQTSHCNVVRLIGFCWETCHQLLVYEYMEKGSLDKWLFNVADEGQVLDWATRFHMVIGIARGLSYLHEECSQPILHLDIKPQNILLDQNFEPKLADFGMSRFLARDASKVITVARGTPGYIAPEFFFSEGVVSKKCDVYSLGMVLLEIVGGRRNVDVSMMSRDVSGESTATETRTEEWHFPSWVARMYAEGKMLDVVDKRLKLAFSTEEATRTINVALWCIQGNPSSRPSAGAVSKWLEGATPLDQPPLCSIACSQSLAKLSISHSLQDSAS